MDGVRHVTTLRPGQCTLCRCLALPSEGLHGITGNHWACERRAARETEEALAKGSKALESAKDALGELAGRQK